MQVLLDSLKTDRHHVLSCIKYEVLGKRPVYDSYKTFCERIGDDVMGFQEFEFWYMRFYNGDVDMDYDRSRDPKPLELLQLPVEIVGKCVEKLDLATRLFTHNVCKPLQTIVDGYKLKFKTIKIYHTIHTFLHLDDYKIDYKPTDDKLGTTVVCGERENKLRRVNTIDFAVSDLRTLLKGHNMQLDSLSIVDFSQDESMLPKCRDVFEEISTSIKTGFSVKELHIGSSTAASVVPLLSFLKPGVLESVSMMHISDEISRTEQWQQARIGRVQIWGGGMNPTEIGKFRHFEEFSVNFSAISPEIMIQLSETLLTFPSLKKCKITTPSNPPFTIDNVATALELPVQNGEVHVPVPDSNDVLVIAYVANRPGTIVIERRHL